MGVPGGAEGVHNINLTVDIRTRMAQIIIHFQIEIIRGPRWVFGQWHDIYVFLQLRAMEFGDPLFRPADPMDDLDLSAG